MNYKFSVGVEHDDTFKNSFMVVIRDETNKIVGIPARDIHNLDSANNLFDPIRFAFEYGYITCKNNIPTVVAAKRATKGK